MDVKRPETGPMAFGDDWPGLFVRGDDAQRMAWGLREALAAMPEGDDALAAREALGAATRLLERCAVQRHDPRDCQRLAGWEDCQPVTALPPQPAPRPEGVDVVADLIHDLLRQEGADPGEDPDGCDPATRQAVALLRQRRQVGIERYGQPLMSADGRDTRRDLREELLDAAVYSWSLAIQLAAAGGRHIEAVERREAALGYLWAAVELDGGA